MKTKKREFQKNFDRSKIKVGCFVEKKFFDYVNEELLWCKIIKIKRNGLLIGEIIDIPRLVKGFNQNQRVNIKLTDISDFKI